MLTIKAIVEYTIPMFGNKRSLPYGKLLVTDGKKEKVCAIQDDSYGRQYVTFNRKRYAVKNYGGLYSPKFEVLLGGNPL